MDPRPHRDIIAFCESCLDQHGDSARGVGWLYGDAEVRHRVMLGVIRDPASPASVLDFGCGASHLYEYILRTAPGRIRYAGLDLSERFLELSRRKFPDVPYYRIDVLDPFSEPLPPADYVILNGVLTYKAALSHEEMFRYAEALLGRVYAAARIGIAFNVMSRQPGWGSDQLFEVPVDEMMDFLARTLSRHVVIRRDYGLYEYTVYVYREPS
jgi:SAM-dependent methyltransferase